jgi:quercetin dioxygenase-like cupin family protein
MTTEQEDSLELVQETTEQVERTFDYERVFVRAIKSDKYSLKEERRRQRESPRVYKSSQKPWTSGPVKWNKSLLNPGMGLTQTIQAAFEELAPSGKSQKHGHQNGALMYVLNGVGYDVHDGQRTDWKAGDTLLVPPGVVHQHFNASDTEPCRLLVFKGKPIYNFAGLNYQEYVELAPKEPREGWEDFHPGEWGARRGDG